MDTHGRLVAGRYRLGALLGGGRAAEVVQGEDLRLGRTVAVKLLHPTLGADPALRLRFREESQTIASLQHPTIARVYDAGEETVLIPNGEQVQRPYLVVEYVNGAALTHTLSHGPVPMAVATRILVGVLTALEVAHRAHITHGSLALKNVMLSESGAVKVLDFGIERILASTHPSNDATCDDPGSDLVAAGTMLFELLTGQHPDAREGVIPVPSTLNPTMSPAFDAVVRRALHPDPARRYPTAATFREDVLVAAEGRVPQELPEPAPTEENQEPAEDGLLGFYGLNLDRGEPQRSRRPRAHWIWVTAVGATLAVTLTVVWANTLQPVTVTRPLTVPSILGSSYEDATTALQAQGLTVRRVDVASNTGAVDHVIGVDPSVGTTVTAGDTVTVTVSAGKAPVAVPNVTNQSVGDATKGLQAAGFTVATQSPVSSATTPKGMVVDTAPMAGQTMPPGTAITLYVSTGTVELPSLVGIKAQDAVSQLSDPTLQLQPQLVADPGCKRAAGLPVTKQSPAPGQVAQRAAITLTYCGG